MADIKTKTKSLGALLAEYLTSSGLARPNETKGLWKAWQSAVGEDVADHTRLMSLRAGLLLVEVDSAPWLQELNAIGRSSLVAAMRQRMEGAEVTDIDLRLGTF